MNAPRDCRGLTLIEMVMAIAVLGVALPPITALYREVAEESVDDTYQGVATMLAESMLEEIASKAFSDPESALSSFGAEEASRASYDDVDDYDGLNESPPELIDGTLLSGYPTLRVAVEVDNVTSSDPDPVTPARNGSTDLKRIRVTASWRGGRTGAVTLTTLRTRLPNSGGGLPDLIDGAASAATVAKKDDDEFNIQLVNLTDQALLIESFEMSCSSGGLDGTDQLKFEGSRIWDDGDMDGPDPSNLFPTTVLPLVNDPAKRTIPGAGSPELRVRIITKPAAGTYTFTLVLFFSDGTSDHIDFSATWT